MKRLDNVEVIAALVIDVYKTSVPGASPRTLRLTLNKIKRRYAMEGFGFLSKTLPSLGKALDRALSSNTPLNCGRFRKEPSTQLPMLFGELFKQVFNASGMVLNEPNLTCIRGLRDILYLFYKYETPIEPQCSGKVIAGFIQTEQELSALEAAWKDSYGSDSTGLCVSSPNTPFGVSDEACISHYKSVHPYNGDDEFIRVIRSMRREAHRLFSTLDLTNIIPRHGPGIVSTGETLANKYTFNRYIECQQSEFPWDSYMCPSPWFSDLVSLTESSPLPPPARVLLVPKDSRGPRLISCEPLENQWIQQGISERIVKHLESHRKTRYHVNFTDQRINRNLALYGSRTGRFATLDLKDASDRVSNLLVKTVFPRVIVDKIQACRTPYTQLPDGSVIPLAKFAPMGSALCFPILATIAWLTLTSGTGACSRETTYVYGDDIIVSSTDVDVAIKRLELVGLKVNVNKSCLGGFFRESCGMDAYAGYQVTPLRLRRPPNRHDRAASYVSLLEKSNEAYTRGYMNLANCLATIASSIYDTVCNPNHVDRGNNPLQLWFVPTPIDHHKDLHYSNQGIIIRNYDGQGWKVRSRLSKWSKNLQKRLYETPTLVNRKVRCRNDYQNYFKKILEIARRSSSLTSTSRCTSLFSIEEIGAAASYTPRDVSKLTTKWR